MKKTSYNHASAFQDTVKILSYVGFLSMSQRPLCWFRWNFVTLSILIEAYLDLNWQISTGVWELPVCILLTEKIYPTDFFVFIILYSYWAAKNPTLLSHQMFSYLASLSRRRSHHVSWKPDILRRVYKKFST